MGQIEAQRQQLPLQHGCEEGALPLATTGTSAPSEHSPSSPGKALSHCVPATGSTCTHPSAAPVQAWPLPLNSSSAPGIPMSTTGEQQLRLTHLLSGEANQSPNGFPKGHLPNLCAGPGRETRKETDGRFSLLPGTRAQPHGCGEKRSWNRPRADNNLQRCFYGRGHRIV